MSEKEKEERVRMLLSVPYLPEPIATKKDKDEKIST